MSIRFKLKITAITVCTGLFALSPFSYAYAKKQEVLNIYNWSNYIGPKTIANFEKETGIQVHYDVYDSTDAPLTKLIAGNSGYDIMIMDAPTAGTAIKANLLTTLDKAAIPNLKNLDPQLEKLATSVDPNNAHTVLWLWGFVGLGINEQAVTKALDGTPMPANLWSLIFDPAYAKKVSKCGLSITSSSGDSIPEALIYLNKPYQSTNLEDYKAALKLMLSIKPYITRIETGGYIDNLASDNTCVAMGYSGDFNIAAMQAKETKRPYTIKTLLPDQGAFMTLDVAVIPKDAKHVSNAEKFLNYILQPKVAASLSDTVYYANPVPESLPYINKKVLENKGIFLDNKGKAKLIPPLPYNLKAVRLENKTFNEFKAGVSY